MIPPPIPRTPNPSEVRRLAVARMLERAGELGFTLGRVAADMRMGEVSVVEYLDELVDVVRTRLQLELLHGGPP